MQPNETYYWEPHTSSIDFCEENYLHSNYIVEIHNVWSSLLGISLFGIIGLIYHPNLNHEKRNLLAYWILVLIGIGSAGLHGSLHWIFQSSDEVRST
jgi:dihydroceramidase